MSNKKLKTYGASDNNDQLLKNPVWSEFFDNLIFIAIVIIISVTPLVFSKSIYQSFSLAKGFVFKFSLGLVLIFWCLHKISTKWDKTYLLKVKLLAIPMLLFGFFTIISTLQGIDPWISLVGIYTRHIGLQGILTIVFGYFALAFSMNKKKDIDFIFFSFSVCALIIGIYATMQFFGLDIFNWVNVKFARVPSTAGNANLLGNIVSLLFPIPIYYLFFSNQKLIKFGAGISMFFILLATLFCMSRANWLAIMASVVFYAFLYVRIQKGNQQLKKVIIISMIGSLFIIQLLLNSLIVERGDSPLLITVAVIIHAFMIACFKFQEIWTGITLKISTSIYVAIFILTMMIIIPLNIYTSKDSFAGKYFSIFHYEDLPRYYLLRDSIHVIKKHFFFGTGEGTYRIAYMPYKSLQNEIAEPKANYDSPHNNYITVLATQGIFAFLAYLSIFFLIFKKGIQAVISPHIQNSDKYLVITFLTIFFSYLVWSLASFDSDVTNPVMVGLYASYSYLIYELFYKDSVVLYEQKLIFSTKILMTILIPFAALSVYQSYLIYQADTFYGMGLRIKNSATKYLSSNTPSDKQTALNVLTKANAMFTKALEYNPKESFYNVDMADLHHSLYVLTGDQYHLDQIYKYLDLSEVHSWDPGKYYMVKVKTELTRGRNQEAINYATKVLKDLPHNAIVRSQLGFMLFKEGGADNFRKALVHFERALKVDKTNLLALVYTSEIFLRFGKFDAARLFAQKSLAAYPDKASEINGLLARINTTEKNNMPKK